MTPYLGDYNEAELTAMSAEEIAAARRRGWKKLAITEVRVTDPDTGGQKGTKPVQLTSLLEMCPPAFLTDLGKLYAFGAAKYEPDNWKRGYSWRLSSDALLRHLTLALGGEWLDSESGLPHVVHVAWHCATLHTFERENLGTDDRVHRP